MRKCHRRLFVYILLLDSSFVDTATIYRLTNKNKRFVRVRVSSFFYSLSLSIVPFDNNVLRIISLEREHESSITNFNVLYITTKVVLFSMKRNEVQLFVKFLFIFIHVHIYVIINIKNECM
jgi:hypothetical protein